MKLRVLKILLVAIFSLSLGVQDAFAQANPQAEGQVKGHGPRAQFATIIFAGLGGAILGLSTLSFYSRPQDNLENIAIGLAAGVVIGTGFVTYKAIFRPDEFYGEDLFNEQSLFDQMYQIHGRPRPLAKLSYQWTF